MSDQKYKALILDDEYPLGEILVTALNEHGVDSVAVTDVDSAIRELEGSTFDIVISDIYLPEKNGRDLFNYAQKYFPDLPFIFITGNPNLETAVDFLKRGAYDYLSKPFMLPDLVDKVHEVISKSRKKQIEKNILNDLKEIRSQRFKNLRIYEDIFASKRDGLLILDTEGIIEKVNPGFEEMSGLKESELRGQPISFLNGRIFPDLCFDDIRKISSETGEWKKEVRANKANGEQWIANISLFPVSDEKGVVFAYSAIINDVTSLRSVEKAYFASLEQTNLAQGAIIFGLARLAEYRDQATGYHLERIRSYSKKLAEMLQHAPDFRERIDEKFIHNIYRTAPLHDIGKVGISDNILLKKGQLTPEEFEIMKTHTIIGYHTLNSIRRQYGEMDFLNMGIEIAYCHHERFDGKGYPRGLQGAAIPLSAQIVAVADVYDALTTKRVYKEAYSHQKALQIMNEERGAHFDPRLYDVFFSIAADFDQIRQNFAEQDKEEAENHDPPLKVV